MRKANIIAKKILAVTFAAFAIFAVCIVYLAAQAGFKASAIAADPSGSNPPAPQITFSDTEFDYNGMSHNPLQQEGAVVVRVGNTPLTGDKFYFTYVNEDGEELTNAPVDAGKYEVTLLVPAAENGDYAAAQAVAIMTVNRILPKLSFSNQTPLQQIYSQYVPVAAFAEGYFADGFREEIPVAASFEGTEPDVGNYTVTATFGGSKNYLPHQIQSDLVIIQKQISVAFEGPWDPIYTGKPLTRRISHDELPEGLEITLTYNGEPYGIDCGLYTIEMSVNNPNYRLKYDVGQMRMEIRKADLLVSLGNLTVNQGAQPKFTYTYSGFVAGEGPEVLTAPPRVDPIPQRPGIYQLTPYGAAAKNYIMSYLSGTLTINHISLDADLEGGEIKALLESSFHPSTALSFKVVQDTDESFSTVASILKDRSQIIAKSDIVGVYDLSFSAGGLSGADKFKVTLFNVKLSPLFVHRVAVIDSVGNYYKIDKFVYKDNTLVFNSYSDGKVIIYRTSLITYLTAGFLGAAALAIAIYRISAAISYRKLKTTGGKEPEPAPPSKPRYDW